MKQVYIVYVDGDFYGVASTWHKAYVMAIHMMLLKGFQITGFLHLETADFFTCQKDGVSMPIEVTIEEQEVDALPAE